MSAPLRIGRIRAYLEFVAAILYFFVAQSSARHFALRFLSDEYSPLIEQAVLVLLLVLGYAAFGALFDRQRASSRLKLPASKGAKACG